MVVRAVLPTEDDNIPVSWEPGKRLNISYSCGKLNTYLHIDLYSSAGQLPRMFVDKVTMAVIEGASLYWRDDRMLRSPSLRLRPPHRLTDQQ